MEKLYKELLCIPLYVGPVHEQQLLILGILFLDLSWGGREEESAEGKE